MNRKQIILAALFICVACISGFAQVSVFDRKIKVSNPTGLADLSIRQVKFSGKSGRFLKVEVENKGNKSSGITHLLLTIEGSDKSLRFRQKAVFVTGIESGQTKWVSIIASGFSVQNGSLKSTAFKLVIDPNQNVPESDETNNEYVHQAENQDDNSIDESKDSDEVMENEVKDSDEVMEDDSTSSDETLSEDTESVDTSNEESESQEDDSTENSENSDDSVVDESENPDPSGKDTKTEKEKPGNKSSKEKKVKAVSDLIDNINVLIKPSSKPKKKP